jgi:hypothetical protein
MNAASSVMSRCETSYCGAFNKVSPPDRGADPQAASFGVARYVAKRRLAPAPKQVYFGALKRSIRPDIGFVRRFCWR